LELTHLANNAVTPFGPYFPDIQKFTLCFWVEIAGKCVRKKNNGKRAGLALLDADLQDGSNFSLSITHTYIILECDLINAHQLKSHHQKRILLFWPCPGPNLAPPKICQIGQKQLMTWSHVHVWAWM